MGQYSAVTVETISMSAQPPSDIAANTIQAIREQLDQLDERLVALLNQRAELARRIGALKAQTDNSVAFVPARERAVLDHVAAANGGPLPDEAIRGVFQQIIAACRNLEQPVTVAYLGPAFTFSHQAAMQRFGATAALLPADSIGEVIDLVEHGQAHYGVAPIENSTEGVVCETLDALYRSTLSIADELHLPIRHALWGSGTLAEVTTVCSHPQALAQCRAWRTRHLSRAEVQATASTARAAELAAGHPAMAAICTPLAAAHYGLTLLADRIEDTTQNRTRFCVLGPAQSQPSGRDKTSIVFSVKHQAGALNRVLEIFERHDINMTLIESRPMKEMPWEYLFYVDFQGHLTDPPVVAALDALRQHCLCLRVLGSYPEAIS